MARHGVPLVVLILMVVVLAGTLVQPVPVVRVTTGRGELLVCSQVSVRTPITLSFTHSMYGGYVRETYRIDGDGDEMARQRILTENSAAAEYYATDGRVRKTAEGYEVMAGPLSVEELVVRVDGIGNHQVSIGDRTWALFDILGEPTQVRLSSKHLPRIRVPDSCDSTPTSLQIKDVIV